MVSTAGNLGTPTPAVTFRTHSGAPGDSTAQAAAEAPAPSSKQQSEEVETAAWEGNPSLGTAESPFPTAGPVPGVPPAKS